MADTTQKHILLTEDNASFADMLRIYLQQEGYEVTWAESAAQAMQHINDGTIFDSLILDLKLSDSDGLDVLKKLRADGFNSPVIISTGYGSIGTAIEAMRLGAADFLVKPYDIEKLGSSLQNSLGNSGLKEKAELVEESEENIATLSGNIAGVEQHEQEEVKRSPDFGGFIGTSPPMQILYDVIENAAQSNAAVFITGESGTGKEVCAEALHKLSQRANKPFIALNCAAIPRELLESELFGHVKGAFTGAISEREGAAAQANGGTLFLDEVTEMHPEMQTKLLRFIQDLTFQKVGGSKQHKADVRIICATNREPIEEIRNGQFRKDLYYRLHVIPIHMPPLRERGEDLIDLATYFLASYAIEEGKNFTGFHSQAEEALLAYSWPGNVRQLQNVIRNIVVMNQGSLVEHHMLPPEILNPVDNLLSSSKEADKNVISEVSPLWRVEKQAIEHAIEMCGGNIPRAAALLEISPSTIYRKKMGWKVGTGNQQGYLSS